MKKNSAYVIIKKLTMYLFVWLLTIAPTSTSKASQYELKPSRIEGFGPQDTSGIMPIVDFRDLAIFARYWLETECNAANNWCGGADLDHLYDRDYDGYPADVDCDDRDPNVFPGAPEVRDGKDNNCDPNGKADEGLIAPGDIIITEILYDSSEVPDEQFEWFEVFNPTDIPVNMRTWLLRDQPSTTQVIAVVNDDVVVPPGGFAVFCHTLSAKFNGGVVCDYEYGHFTLTNTADELILDFDGVIVDEVWYDGNAGWPRATYCSLSLDPNAFLLDNNDPNNWCNSPAGHEIPNGDEATPGAPNVDCQQPL
ncbi:MAG TPA: MopE-related protein [Sedimentisphaerales bacterium]|nr:MopE-related protein [Sedimentisphaerales bacterium]